MDIFKSISRQDSHNSRHHAAEYMNKLAEAIDFIAKTQSIINSCVPVEKRRSTDTITTTAPRNMDGMKQFKMAFNCDSGLPFAVEIIEEGE